jgi:hypothetical protein
MPLQPNLLERTLFMSRNRGPAASVGLWLRKIDQRPNPAHESHRTQR